MRRSAAWGDDVPWWVVWCGGVCVGAVASAVVLRGRGRDPAPSNPAPAPSDPAPAPGTRLPKSELLRQRRALFCPAQSVSYANSDPLVVVGGRGQVLVDDEGREFLDTRNNVAHVGHANPRVATAVAAQAALVNTNTRYLHPNRVRLAQRLLAHFPPALGKVFFVNSGSEANDLALRLARAHTKRKAVVVVERAYHGNTLGVIDVSPYKFAHPKGPGKPAHVHVVPCPDSFRSRRSPSDAGAKFAADVQQACAVADGGVCALIVESGMSVAGVVLPPPASLQQCFEHVRAAGGVCIADEVQVGFGRLGEWFWGFEQQCVVPDIVTMGKPFGNGMALAAVVTTVAISDSFANGPEYFNTFGGNPVACAAGLAVLDAIEQEGLQQNAKTVGAFLMSALRGLQEAHPLVGDVRGHGLFVGVEFVRDRETLEPATAEASLICTRLKEKHRILTSLDGAFDNVMVIKPPMCFSCADATRLCECLAVELRAVGREDLSNASHTPT